MWIAGVDGVTEESRISVQAQGSRNIPAFTVLPTNDPSCGYLVYFY